jgi:histidyl-tRNA synthetase
VLDCKRKACIEATRNAPRTVDHLCGPCKEHFDRVQAGLGALGISYAIETRLVRGLDYYTRTTFEFQASALDGAQNAIGGGGRYNGLVESLGGSPTPGIGFGSGIERVLLACDAEEVFPTPDHIVDVFVVDVAGGEWARDLSFALRRAGIAADRAFDGRSMKSQMKAADRSGARLALIVGEDEVANDSVTVRHLRGDAEQERVPRPDVIDRLRSLLDE